MEIISHTLLINNVHHCYWTQLILFISMSSLLFLHHWTKISKLVLKHCAKCGRWTEKLAINIVILIAKIICDKNGSKILCVKNCWKIRWAKKCYNNNNNMSITRWYPSMRIYYDYVEIGKNSMFIMLILCDNVYCVIRFIPKMKTQTHMKTKVIDSRDRFAHTNQWQG